MTDFRETYKSYSVDRLLRIVENAADYQPEAVEAAKRELLDRNPAPEEVAAARASLEAERQERLKREREYEIKIDRRKQSVKSLLEDINPIDKEDTKPIRTIKLIAIVMGAVYLYLFAGQFTMFRLVLAGSWDLWTLAYLLSVVYLPVTLVLFWRLRKAGWVMFMIYLAVAVVSRFYGLYYIVAYSFWGMSGTSILSIVFLAAIIYTICKKDIRRVFF